MMACLRSTRKLFCWTWIDSYYIESWLVKCQLSYQLDPTFRDEACRFLDFHLCKGHAGCALPSHYLLDCSDVFCQLSTSRFHKQETGYSRSIIILNKAFRTADHLDDISRLHENLLIGVPVLLQPSKIVNLDVLFLFHFIEGI